MENRKQTNKQTFSGVYRVAPAVKIFPSKKVELNLNKSIFNLDKLPFKQNHKVKTKYGNICQSLFN